MTSEEMTTGSVGATETERKWAAGRSRWWNSTGGGSASKTPAGKGNVKAGDGGAKFKQEWPELHAQNMAWMKENDIDLATGNSKNQPAAACGPTAALRRPSGSAGPIGAVVEGGQVARDAGGSWLRNNKLLLAGAVIFTYVLVARLLGEGT